MNNKIKDYLKSYSPKNQQEEKDLQMMLQYLADFDNLLTRENEYAHFTSSSLIVNKERTKTLLIYHNIYNSWSWTGGHADGDDDFLAVAIKEAMEETGVKNIKAASPEIYSVDILPVWGHVKRGKYVAAHQHLNLCYLLEADENQELIVKPDENSGVAWYDLDKMVDASGEPEMKKVYQKLIQRLK